MRVLSMITQFLGALLRALWPAIAEEAKKPGEVQQAGGDSATRDAVADDIVRDADED